MISFEQEVRDFLTSKKVTFEDNSRTQAGFTDPDFMVQLKHGHMYMELKEKRQKYDPTVWPIEPKEEVTSFILDEFTARKLMSKAERAFMLVRDNTTGLYYYTDVYALWLMPRIRVNRRMIVNDSGQSVLKGKWILNLRNFYMSDNLLNLFVQANKWIGEVKQLMTKGVACYNPFGNEIQEAGTTRTKELREFDVKVTS